MTPLALRVLGLAALPGVGPTTVRRVAAQMGGWPAVADAAVEQVLLVVQAVAGKRAQTTPDHWTAAVRHAELQIAAVRTSGADVLVVGDPAWPRHLERLERDAPLWLYVRGDPAVLSMPGIAIIGSREPTDYGLRCAERFGLRTAEAGLSVISGLALGCDGAAHAGCLQGRGRGIAVLPGPIDRIIPSSHRDLADRLLAEGGCLVSEYAPDPTADIPAHQFVARDRIQTGLALGVLLTESSLTGGSMHAVRAAQRNGIPVACLYRDDAAWLAARVTEANRQMLRPDAAGRVGATALATPGDLQAWLARCRALAPGSSP
jgi:DNA processing protein